MANTFLERQTELIAAAYQLAAEHACELKRHSTSTTEGGARTVTVHFVLVDGDGPAKNGRLPAGEQTTIEEHVNGQRSEAFETAAAATQREVDRVDHDQFGGFAAPRVHRPGAEDEQ